MWRERERSAQTVMMMKDFIFIGGGFEDFWFQWFSSVMIIIFIDDQKEKNRQKEK